MSTDEEEPTAGLPRVEQESEDDTLQEKRPQKLTKKGLEYKKSLLFKEREYTIRILDKRSESFRDLIERDTDIACVRKAYTTWLTMYEEYLDQHQVYQKLTSSEVQEDNIVFDRKNDQYISTKNKCERWILTHDRAPSVKQSTMSRKSGTSKGSSYSISSEISISKSRKKQRCQYCNGRHPTILHVEPAKPENVTENVHATASATNTGAGKQALPLVPVRVKAKESSHYIETYAFLDSGSNATFCLQSIADTLGIQGRRKNIGIKTLNGEHSQYTSQLLNSLEICSLDGKSTVELRVVYTRPELPVTEADVIGPDELYRWNYLKDVPIQRIVEEASVGLLIGVDTPKAMEPWDVIPCQDGGPFAVKTALGWVINGPIDLLSVCEGSFTSNYIKTESLEEQVDRYFNCDFSERTCERIEPSVDDKRFLDIVSKSVKRVDGHYETDLPFKETQSEPAGNREQAMAWLLLHEKRFRRDSVFKGQYIDFIDKVIEKGYGEKLLPEDVQRPAWYLPHHGVFQQTKGKLRVVFDCAARYRGTSLNESLLSGPNLANTLVGTLLRFRQEEVAIIGDIESMFYQVRVPPPMCLRYQRFLWWEKGDTDAQPTEYRMNVHLFGSASSPSCANFALKQAAIDCRGSFNEEVINTVLRNFYVGDCLKSVNTAEKAVSMIHDVKSVLSYGGFHISKWLSNNRNVMESIPVSDRAKASVDLDLDKDDLPVERALGLSWSADTDELQFTVNVKEHALTRKGLLSTISSIYDPLGFLAPLLLNAKAVLQELCALKLARDDPLPDRYVTEWNKIVAEMKKVKNFKVSRCFKPEGFGEKNMELHQFSDAMQGGCSTELPKEQVASMCQLGKTGPYQRIYLDTAREASVYDISHVPLCQCRLFLTNVNNLSIEVNGTSVSCGVLLLFKSGSSGSTTTSPICPRNFTRQSLTLDGTTYFDVSLISILAPLTSVNYCVTLTPDDSYSRLQMVCGSREWPNVPIASSTTNPTEVESLHPAWIAFIVVSVVAIVGVAGVCLYFKRTHRGDDRRKLQNEE